MRDEGTAAGPHYECLLEVKPLAAFLLADRVSTEGRLMLMQYTLKVDDAVCPEAVFALAALSDSIPLFHDKHGSRHPVAIYNTSLSSVGRRLLRMVEHLSDRKGMLSHLATNSPQWSTELIERHDALLDALMEHTEDCDNILVSFFESAEVCKKHPLVRTYSIAIKKYRKHIGHIVNEIKHKQGRIRLVFLSESSAVCPGYFIEGLDHKGIVGPSPWIHKEGATAFSFNRDLRYHVCNVLEMSRHLATCVWALSGGKQEVSMEAARKKDEFTRAIEQLALFPVDVFPDETTKAWPELGILPLT